MATDPNNYLNQSGLAAPQNLIQTASSTLGGPIAIPLDQTVQTQIGTNDTLNIPDISSKEITKSFGRPEDRIELRVFNSNGQIIYSEEEFADFSFGTLNPNNTSDTISLDPEKILNERGFSVGKYNIQLYIYRVKIFNTADFPFSVKEISNSRREVKAIVSTATNSTFNPAISSFISEIESSAYFREFSLYFGDGRSEVAINILLNKQPLKHEVLLKTLNPLPSDISLQSTFKIVEEIVDPISIDVNLGDPIFEEEFSELQGPNYNIEVDQKSSMPSQLKSYNQILNYFSTSSYNHLLNYLEEPEKLNIQYDYIRPVSASSVEEVYHFENFTHFSNATARLKNFEYKLKLIESYDKETKQIESITGATSGSPTIIETKKTITDKKEKLIQQLDGYEHFLYFTSGTFAWPKSNSTAPYVLKSISSSEAVTWLGHENSSYPNYGGQLLSASLFDRQNPYSLNLLIPEHVKSNIGNKLYIDFVNMIGEHFDKVWTYIRHITETKNSDNNKGISKDLVYYQLQSLGIDTFDQFENTDLIEYILGEGSGSNFYNTNNKILSSSEQKSGLIVTPSETLITSSNQGSIPKGDITKEIWKRLYHNSSYLLKTKGTERGLRALMNCYGIPSTILNIKEYGGSIPLEGPYKDLKTSGIYKTFSYEKSGLALKGTSGTGGYFIKTPWSSSLTDTLSASAKTVEFRIKPTRQSSNVSYHLFSLSGSTPNNDPILVLSPYTGNDISSSGDSAQYGRLDLYLNGAITASTSYFPVYNGDFWNIHIGSVGTSGSSANINFGAYKSNFLKNIFYYNSSVLVGEQTRSLTFGDPYYSGNKGGAEFVYIGGVTANSATSYDNLDNLSFSGSIQEIKYHFGELLSHDTLKKHALEPFMYSGNTISSSYSNVVLRLPLGSNDMQDSSSFHPQIDKNYLGGGTSSLATVTWEEVVETHHLPTPDTVGASMTSEKVRIDEGTVYDNNLSLTRKKEISTLDRQPPDFEDLGIFFSPSHEINEDILYTLGSFRLDDYIGSPLMSAQTASTYEELSNISDIYFKKVKRRYNYWDYLKVIQQLDHTLFKLIQKWVPFKANTKTGFLIEPTYLERNKIQRELPTRNDGTTMITGSHQTFEVQLSTDFVDNKILTMESSSLTHDSNFVGVGQSNQAKTKANGRRNVRGTNAEISFPEEIYPFKDPQNIAQAPIKPFLGTKPFGYITHESDTLLGNAVKGRLSSNYYKYATYKPND